MMKAGWGAAALGLALVASPARAQTIDATDAKAVQATLQEAGWQAKLSKSGDGDPKIEGRISKSDYQIFFYGCEKNTNCTSLQVSAGWTLKTKPTVEAMNDWNRDKRFASAYLDKDGDPHLQMSINMFGGVTRKNLEDTLDWWRVSITEFEKTIGW